MQQMLRITARVGVGQPNQVSLTLADRRNLKVDRLQAYVRVVPRADGTVPSQEQIDLLEGMLCLRLARDPQLRNLFTPQAVPVKAFQSREIGPVPVAPFPLDKNEQFTLEWALDNNAFAMTLFANSAEVWVDVVLWGNDERNA